MEQCMGCNGGFENPYLEKSCCSYLCITCRDRTIFCTECCKPIPETMQSLIRKRSSISFLLQSCPFQNSEDKKYGVTAYEEAARMGDLYFLEHMIDVNLCSQDKEKIMDLSIFPGNEECIGFLKERHFPFNYYIPEDLIEKFPFLNTQEAQTILMC